MTAFSRAANPTPTPADRRAEILSAPGFGRYFTDHMVTIRWGVDRGWYEPAVRPYSAIELDPATSVLHYGQAIFEGLKAFRQPDGSIRSFRPEANAERLRRSARRMAMPELPHELFLASLRELLAVDHEWVPPAGGEESLYLRPFMIATAKGLDVKPSTEYLYLVIASPSGPFFAGGVQPVTVWLCTEYVRAAPGGTGAAKFAGNYAASLAGYADAAEQGCDQVVWLDAVEHRWVEEMGGMNLFFVFGDHLVTPELSGALLPGITRDSLFTLARETGLTVEERRISTDEWEKRAESGELTEVFACGTAAVITPVGHVKHAGGEFAIGGGEPGEVTMNLREILTSIQRGASEDIHGWMTTLRGA